MVCTRCGEVLDTYKQERNADSYGSNIYACPKCGKPYRFSRQVVVTELSVDTQLKEDDWGHRIVNDVTFSKKRLAQLK
jgi:DNA-directed RNA polymerase subunit M/transcription elongation factor TFIIS